MSAAHGGGFFLGITPTNYAFAPPEHAVLVLGPPRSGKTSSLIVPNVLAARGGVLVTSTKRDALDATVVARQRVGPCMLFDPSGTVAVPPGVQPVGWSPLRSSQDFGGAMETAWAMVTATRPEADRGDAAHWNRRAQQLLACLFHAAARAGDPFPTVVSALGRREPSRSLDVLVSLPDETPFIALSDITRTEEREQSGIWSTASSICAGYYDRPALDNSLLPPVDPRLLTEAGGTLYVVAPSSRQQETAAIVTGMLHEVRNAVYAAHGYGSLSPPPERGEGARREPVRFVLDELANIAPMHDLPELLSEGAGQGVLTLACLQDLSQARDRWGARAGGFLTLFGTKVVLPGIADSKTLHDLSLLTGDALVATRSTTHSAGRRFGGRSESRTQSFRRDRVLQPSEIARGHAGEAYLFVGSEAGRVALMPYHRSSPWREAALAGSLGRDVVAAPARSRAVDAERHRPGFAWSRGDRSR